MSRRIHAERVCHAKAARKAAERLSERPLTQLAHALIIVPIREPFRRRNLMSAPRFDFAPTVCLHGKQRDARAPFLRGVRL